MTDSSTDSKPDFSAILPSKQLETMIQNWIALDMPSFDVGSIVVGSNATAEAELYQKSPGVFAGKPFFDMVFQIMGCQVIWNDKVAVEGTFIDPQQLEPSTGKVVLATVKGLTRHILQGERTALNTLSRCAGIATAAQQTVAVAQRLGWKGYVAGTRKTTPGNFRLVEKYGLLVGGAATHRMDLSQMVMLKDNHIQAAGSITRAVQHARTAAGFSQKIEVECQSLAEAVEAATAGADICMLDNFAPSQLKADAAMFKAQFPHVLIEASGGITVATMPEYLSEHVDIVSQGKLTQGYDCVDYSLKIIV